jgi:hypothetical protein
MESAFDASKGSPNLQAMQYLQENLTPEVISDVKATVAATPKPVNVSITPITADGTAGVETDIPVGATIIDAFVVATATSSGGTVTLKNGSDTIATAMAMAADGAVARMAAGVDDTKLVVGEDGVSVFAGQAADRGIVHILYIV